MLCMTNSNDEYDKYLMNIWWIYYMFYGGWLGNAIPAQYGYDYK